MCKNDRGNPFRMDGTSLSTICCVSSVLSSLQQSLQSSLQHHRLQHARIPCLSLFSRVCSNSSLLSWWCCLMIIFSVILFSSCLNLSSIRVFSIKSAAAKSLQSCPTLCDPIDSSPPGSPIPGILQARTLEWVVISFSNAWKWKVKVKLLSRVRLLATPRTAAHQAPASMGFSRQEY